MNTHDHAKEKKSSKHAKDCMCHCCLENTTPLPPKLLNPSPAPTDGELEKLARATARAWINRLDVPAVSILECDILTALRSAVQKCDGEKEALRNSNREIVRITQSQLQSKSAEIEGLKYTIRETGSEIENLSKSLDKQDNELTAKDSEIAELKGNLLGASEAADAAIAACGEHKEEIAELKQALRDESVLSAQWHAKADHLEQQLLSAESDCAAMRQCLKDFNVGIAFVTAMRPGSESALASPISQWAQICKGNFGKSLLERLERYKKALDKLARLGNTIAQQALQPTEGNANKEEGR